MRKWMAVAACRQVMCQAMIATEMIMSEESQISREKLPTQAKKPPWLTRRALTAKVWQRMKAMLDGLALATIDVLVPDFQGDEAALQTVARTQPEVFGHNVEVVPRLYPKIRSQASYERSLHVLRRAKELWPFGYTKSGLMVGVGEQEQEVIKVMHDLRAVGCDFLTIGQYLRPSAQHFPVIEYVTPATFDHYAQVARNLRFRGVHCGPFVRSSYRAGELLENAERGL